MFWPYSKDFGGCVHLVSFGLAHPSNGKADRLVSK